MTVQSILHNSKTYYYNYSNMATNNCGSTGFSDIKVTSEQPAAWGIDSRSPVAPREVLNAVYEVLYAHFNSSVMAGFNKLWLFVGPVDYQAPDTSTIKKASCIVTHDFVNWLIETNKGMVVSSPVFANINYGMDPASLNQMWIFIPHTLIQMNRVILGTEGMHNVPEVDDKFYETVAKSINPYTKRFEDMFSSLNDGHIQRYAKARDAINAEKEKIILRRRTMRWISKSCDAVVNKCA